MTVEEMDRAHRDDMRAHRLIEDAARALRKLLEDEHGASRLRYIVKGDAHVTLVGLEREAAQIVRTWD